MSLGDIFYKTLIEGGSWLTILKGLWVTVEITLLSMVLGTLLAALVCALRLRKGRFPRTVASVYIAVLRGSPVLLLLMIMYYVVFAKSTLSAPLIAVAAYTLNFSAHAAEVMRAALSATDKMQTEAARTLGFSKWQAFRLITLPQAAKIAKPVYQSTIVNLIQWTSVVGYVTITDLTRVINNISSRTMQPLFMLLVGIALYLGLAYLCYGVFAWLDRREENRVARRQAQ
ncbi:MAG: amino acid ABC transporter permease [Clostridia bacterium]